MGKKVDYDGMLSVYIHIGKTRELTEAELARVDEIVKRRTAANKTARYRARHKEEINRRQRDFKAANPDRVRAAEQRYTARHSIKLASNAKRWREENPDKVEAYRAVRRQRDLDAKNQSMRLTANEPSG